MAFIPFPHLCDAQAQQLLFGFVDFLFVFECEGLVDDAVGDVEVVDVGILLIGFDGEDVHVMNGAADNLAFFAQLFQGNVAFFDNLGFLELQILAEDFHLLKQFLPYFT